MRRYYVVSGILLILPIIDFALAAPVLVQENRQAGVDVHTPEDSIITLGKRGDDLNKLFSMFEDHFTKPESSAARPSLSSPPSGPDHGWTNVEKPLPSIPEKPSPVSSPDNAPPNPESLTEPGHELVGGDAPPGPSRPASSTMSDADHELVGAHEPPNPGLSTESDHQSTAVHAPLSTPVFPTWFLTDHGYMGPHAPKPDLGSDSDHRFVVEEPPSSHEYMDEYQMVHPPPTSPRSALPIESDHEMVDVPPSSSVSSTNHKRQSMGAHSRLENLQAMY